MSYPNHTVTSETLGRWCAYTKPFPLPPHVVPTGGNCLMDVSDEVLLSAPPQLIAHALRTSAQGGLQVVSPRQTPFSALMTRGFGGDRTLGDHVVGSVADPTAKWPTLDDADFDHLLPDEPLSMSLPERAVKTKTVTEPLTKAGKLLSDPILSCLVKGRAVIDILRRSDVAGGADELTDILAAAWGIDTNELDELDAFTLAIEGPLLRHAIKADEVYPMCYAPTHVKRVISVGANEVTRDLLPSDSAMDWRRMRIFCEAVYTLACAVEGVPVKHMRCYPPPGDPSAKTDRPGVMVFLPAPGVAWSFASDTFSICPSPELQTRRYDVIPREVLEALSRYTSVVRPVSHLISMGHRSKTRRTEAQPTVPPINETIADSYRMLARNIMTGASRGRTAASTVRNLIFSALEAAPLMVRLRLARYMYIAKTEVKAHLGITEVPDMVIDKLASKFLQVGDTVRLSVLGEAARRGATAAQWWGDIVSQAPERYAMMAEGTMGWARVAMWLMFRSPTEKWDKLVRAVNYSALRDTERSAVGAMSLPAEKGSKERLVAACRGAVKNISSAYSGYYKGVSDVGLAIADTADELGKPRTASILREAAYLWTLRARCLRGTNVNPVAHDEPTASMNHYRVSATPVDLLVVPAPYRAFEAYKKHVETSDIMPTTIKRHFQSYGGVTVSGAFSQLNRPICTAKETTLTRYLTNPSSLAEDLETAWTELKQDVTEVARVYGVVEVEETHFGRKRKEIIIPSENIVLDFTPPANPRKDYFSIIGELGEDEVDWMEALLDRVPEGTSAMIYEGEFEGPAHLRRVLLALDDETGVGGSASRELVN